MASEQLQALMDGVRAGRLSRRDFMRRAAVLGLSGSAIAAFLAACGAAATVAPAVGTTAAGVAPTAAAAMRNTTRRCDDIVLLR